MGIVVDVIKAFLKLYVDVFIKYTLAASITTLLFVIAYYLWMKRYKEKVIDPDKFWEHPAFILSIGWLILTPLLGFVISILSVFWSLITAIVGLYVHYIKKYPEASSIVTVVLFVVFFIWMLILKLKKSDANGFLMRLAIILLIVWFLVTPITGLILRWIETKNNSSSVSKQTTQSTAEQQTISAEQQSSVDKE
jgi:preprotein translocase subunit SecG